MLTAISVEMVRDKFLIGIGVIADFCLFVHCKYYVTLPLCLDVVCLVASPFIGYVHVVALLIQREMRF